MCLLSCLGAQVVLGQGFLARVLVFLLLSWTIIFELDSRFWPQIDLLCVLHKSLSCLGLIFSISEIVGLTSNILSVPKSYGAVTLFSSP